MASATNLKEAGWLEDNGADAIIAQGIEAGGHRGKLAQSTHTRLSFRLLHPRLQFCVKNAEAVGKGDFSPLRCGQNADGCRENPAAELTQLLASEL